MAFGGFQQVVGTAVAYLDLDTSKFESKMSTAMTQISAIGDSSIGFADTMRSVGSGLQTVGSQMTRTFTVPIAGAMAVATKKTMDFEEAMSNVKALGQSGMTDVEKEMEQLREKALELGGSTKFTSKEVADAFGYMALAGWKTDQMLSGISGVLDLAASSGMDLASASDLVTDYLSAFGKEAAYSTKMADMLSYAQANTNTTTEMLGDAFGNSAALMNTAGQSMDTTIALLGMLANEGLKGSEAGTALSATMRDIYQNMYKIEDATQAATLSQNGFTSVTGNMNDLLGKQVIEIGNVLIPVSDVNGAFRDMIDIVADVEKATNGLASAEKTSALQTTFTSRSIKGMSILLEEGAKKTRDFREELQKSDGTASETAKTMLDNLAGSITYLMSAIDNFLIKVGDRLAPYIRKFADWLTKVTEKISNMSDEEFDNMVKIGLWIAAIGPALSILGKLFSVIGTIASALSKISPLITGIIKVVGTIAPTVGKIITGVASGIGKIAALITSNIGLIGTIISKVAGIGTAISGIILAAKNFFTMWNEGFSWAKEVVMLLGIALAAVGAIILGVPALIAAIVAAVIAIVATAAVVIHQHWDEIKVWWDNLCNSISQKWHEIWEGIKEWFIGLWNGIQEWWQSLWDGIHATIQNIVDRIKEKWNEMITWFREAWNGIKEWWSNLWDGIREIVQNVVDKIKELWDKAVQYVKEKVTELVENIKKKIQELWNNVKETLENIWNKVKETMEKIWNNIKEVVANIISHIKEKLEEIKNTIHEKIEQVKEMIKQKIEEIKEAIKEKIEQVRQAIIEAVEKVIETIKNLVQRLKEIIESFIDAIRRIVDTVKDLLHNLVEGLKNLVSNVIRTIQDAVRTFVEGCVTLWETLKDNVTKVFGEVTDFFKKKWDEIKESVKEIIEKFKDIGSKLIENVWEGMKKAWEKVEGWFKEKFGWISDLVGGIQSGISGMMGGVGSFFNGSHASGLDYVPFDGYIAKLHKGERVLTKNENEEYSSDKSSNNSGGDTYIFNNVKDDPYEYARQMKRTKKELAYT